MSRRYHGFFGVYSHFLAVAFGLVARFFVVLCWFEEILGVVLTLLGAGGVVVIGMRSMGWYRCMRRSCAGLGLDGIGFEVFDDYDFMIVMRWLKGIFFL